jgi:hypothetical protein
MVQSASIVPADRCFLKFSISRPAASLEELGEEI